MGVSCPFPQLSLHGAGELWLVPPQPSCWRRVTVAFGRCLASPPTPRARRLLKTHRQDASTHPLRLDGKSNKPSPELAHSVRGDASSQPLTAQGRRWRKE